MSSSVKLVRGPAGNDEHLKTTDAPGTADEPKTLVVAFDSADPVPVGGDAIGAPDDVAADSDEGSFSLIALFKRLLTVLAGMLSGGAAKSVALQKQVAGMCNNDNLVEAAGNYAAGDLLANSDTNEEGLPWEFAGVARVENGTGTIVGASVRVTAASMTARIRIHLFNSYPSGELDDNAARSILVGSAQNYLGFIDLPALESRGGFAFAQVDGIAKQFEADNGGNLQALLELLDAETNEAAGMGVYPVLDVLQD